MASTIQLELVTPERVLVSEEVDEVVAPGYEGEFGVLPDHTPYLVILSIGVLHYRKDGDVRKVAVGGGFAEVGSERMVVLADVAEKGSEIDVDRAGKARDRAEAALRDLSMDDSKYREASLALQRALARLSATK